MPNHGMIIIIHMSIRMGTVIITGILMEMRKAMDIRIHMAKAIHAVSCSAWRAGGSLGLRGCCCQ